MARSAPFCIYSEITGTAGFTDRDDIGGRNDAVLTEGLLQTFGYGDPGKAYTKNILAHYFRRACSFKTEFQRHPSLEWNVTSRG
jgi:hypothetical protein